MNIRNYRSSDLESCTNLILNTSKKYNIEDIIPGKESEFFGFFDVENNKEKVEKFFTESDVIVAEDENGNIIGVLRSEGNRIKSFFVSEKYIHQGIGKSLFEKYKEAIIAEGYKFISLFSSSYAVRFYGDYDFLR